MWNKTGAVGEILLFLGGPLIWAAHFFIMYAAETLFCLRLSGQASASFFAYAVSSAVLAGRALLGLMAW